jgi:prepilin peptidase CpaA
MLSIAILTTLIGLAVAHDIRSRRIPNSLVLSGMLLGLFFQVVAPMGSGLLMPDGGALGPLAGLFGLLTGLAVFMPMYALRTLGAGDVKLLAMVGAWLGVQGVLYAALWTLLAGGVLALGAALATGALRQVLCNLRFMVTSTVINARTGGGAAVQAPARTTGRLPYALAIACGTAIEVGRHWLRAA